jgi:hypothetical protein
MKRPRVIGIGALVLGAALVAGGVRAQPGASPGSGGMAPGQMGSGMRPHGAMPHGQMPRGQMHGPMMGSGAPATAGAPTLPGQDAFGAIAEIVRILDADPATDWAKVDLERLRQHLIDMHEVVLHAEVKANAVAGGLVMDVTGSGRTEQAIRAMVVPHAAELDAMPELAAKTEAVPGGVRLTVTSRDPEDAKAVARVRALGFIGLLTLGAHHQPHHLAMAKGEPLPGHAH